MNQSDERRFQNLKRRVRELEERCAKLEAMAHPQVDLLPVIQKELEAEIAVMRKHFRGQGRELATARAENLRLRKKGAHHGR